MYEGGVNRLAVIQHLCTHQMERFTICVCTTSYFHHTACLKGTCIRTEHRVIDGLNGHCRTNKHIRFHTHIEVGFSTHHRASSVGRDVFSCCQRVRESTLACAREYNVNTGVEHTLSMPHLTIIATSTHTSPNTSIEILSRTSLDTQTQSTLPCHIHLISQLQGRALSQLGRRATSWWVTQNIDKHRFVDADNILGTLLSILTEHITLQRFTLKGHTVTFQREGHRTESILACEHIWSLLSSQYIVSFTICIERKGVTLHTTDESVADGHKTAIQFHHIYRVALHIIIIIVALYG